MIGPCGRESLAIALALRAAPRFFCGTLALAAPFAQAFAGTPERDMGWDALIEQAKQHGGAETKLDLSSSYVFRRPDGSFLTLTRLQGPKRTRLVCLVSKDQNATACVEWDSGKLTLGSRADAATPWTFRNKESLDAFEAEQPGVFEQLFSTIRGLIMGPGTSRKSGSPGYWRYSADGHLYWENR